MNECFPKCGDGVAARGVRGAPPANDTLGEAAQPGLPHRESVRRHGAANVSVHEIHVIWRCGESHNLLILITMLICFQHDV